MIEIIQIRKFEEPFFTKKGDKIRVEHVIGDTVLNFQVAKGIPTNGGLVEYSILYRAAAGLSIYLYDADELWDLARNKNYFCSDPVIWQALQDLGTPKVLEIKQPEQPKEELKVL